MALPSDFDTLLESFKEKLESTDLDDFENTTFDAMQRTILQIQSKQVSERNNRGLAQLEKFLKSLQRYGNVVQRLNQREDITAYIWGPIKFLLKETSTHNRAFDELVIAYKEIGESLPLLPDGDQLFHAQPHMKSILSDVYQNLLEVHSILLDYFKRPEWEKDFDQTWKQRRERFMRQIIKIAQDKSLFENQASPSEIEEARSSIEMAQQAMNARFEEEEQRQLKTVFGWFKASDVDVDHHYMCQLREKHPGTGHWLLKNTAFSHWFDQRFPPIPPLLWLKGVPGSGKTVLASLVVQEAQELRDPAPTVLYFYCRQDNPERNNLISILRTFLKQILQQNNNLLTTFYSQCCRSGENTLSSPDLAKDLLDFAFAKCKSIYIILDGLNECPRDQRQRISRLFRTIVEELPISDPERIRCLFISQDDGAARKDFSGLTSINISIADNMDDMKRYCDIQVRKLKDIFRFTDEKASEIANHVSQSARGMFLLAKLIWNNLEAQISIARLEDELRPDRFPKEINSAYERIIFRITQDSPGLLKDILRLLGWLVCAKRPLTWSEIQGMQSINLNNRSVDFQNNSFAESTKEWCASWIQERTDGTVELVHLTARSFLIKGGYIDLPAEELNLSRLCIDYLNLPIFTQEPTEENILLGDYSFMDYAVLFWLPHLEAGSISRSVSHDTQMSKLQESLAVFIERHLKLNGTRLTLAQRHSDKLEFFKDAPFYNQIEQAVASTKKHLRQYVQPEKLVLDLYDIVIKVRKVLEQTCSNATEESIWLGIEEKYGNKEHLFKCERFNCQFFTLGFSTSNTRDEHLTRHTRPFRCADVNCFGSAMGFPTASARDIHIQQTHSTEDRADREFPTVEDVQRSFLDQNARAEGVGNVFKRPRADEAVVELIEASGSEDDRARPHHKRPRLTEFNCPVCDKKFSKKYNMESHVVTHDTERRYACGHCDKRFTRESDLTRHESTHSGRREHICGGTLRDGTRWGCGKAFARAETLRTHHKSIVGKLCIAPALLQRQRDSNQPQTLADSGYRTATTVENRDVGNDDEASIITQSSTYYSPEQREYVTKNLSLAIIRNLQTVSSPDTANIQIVEHVLSHLRSAIKTFTETVEFDRSVRDQVKAVRLVRRLRADIARELHTSIIASPQSTDTEQRLVDFGTKVEEMNLHDIIGRWDPTMAEDDHIMLDPPHELDPPHRQDLHHEPEATTIQEWQSSSSSSFINAVDSSTGSREFVLESRGDQEAVDRTYPTDKAEMLKRFTQQPAFDTLVATTERLLEQYHFPKLDLIRYRVSRAIRRFSETHKRNVAGFFSIVLKVGWDLRGFLRRNYQTGIHQKLGLIACITGSAENAKLCSVNEYLQWRWPHDNTTLLKAIEASLVAEEPTPEQLLIVSNSGSVMPDQTLQYFTVAGSEDFIISVAQQLSWLAAVCQQKTNVLKYSYVSFTEASESNSQLAPTFEIDVALEDTSISDSHSCWNMLVGPAIVIVGYPIPDRKDAEKGLEISIATMAELAGIPQAVTFGGGVVLKARCHAIVPTVNHGDSIQWHMIDTYPKRLEWCHIDELCPSRLQGLDIESGFWGRRSFLGWCGRVNNLLGTSEYDYSAVQYSNAESPPRWAQVDKITLGFSQWGTLTTEITLGKKDGFSCQRPDDYNSLLDDASRTHVILHDTAHNRAFHTNAEDLILHLLHHRRNQNLTRKGISSGGTRLDELLVANPNRHTTSTREVMMLNAEKLYSVSHQFSSPLPKHVLFKEEVRLLWTTIDGLWAHSYEGASNKAVFKLKLDTGLSLSGWEYMDVLGNTRHMEPKSADLRRTCDQFVKDIKAIVLFGAGFGDLLQPATRDGLCPTLISLPRDESFLSVRVDTLIDLFIKQGSLRDQKKLTSSGLALEWPSQAFEHLHPDHASNEDCISQHTLRLARWSNLKKNHVSMPLETYRQGAVIISGRRPSYLQNLRRVFQKEPQHATMQSQGQIPVCRNIAEHSIQGPGPSDICPQIPHPSGATPRLLQAPRETH